MEFEPTIFSPENPWYIGETSLSHLLMNFDQTYRGRMILVPKDARPDLESVDPEVIGPFMQEVATIGREMKLLLRADRINYASLGNVVGTLHWHIIPRYSDDPNWGGPPWPISQPRECDPIDRDKTMTSIRNALSDILLAGV